MPMPEPSPATAPSVRKMRNRSVYTSSLPVPSAAGETEGRAVLNHLVVA